MSQYETYPSLALTGIRRRHGLPGTSCFPIQRRCLVQPDHYIFRMLYSQGVSLEELEIGRPELKDPRKVWRIFAEHYYLFRGTPTRLWLDFVFQELFGLKQRLSEKTADRLLRYDFGKVRNSGILAALAVRTFQFGGLGDH